MDLEEEMILAAESLMDQNAISGREKGHSGKWDLWVRDGTFHFQTEILLQEEIIQNYRCNCTFFNQNRICGHVSGALYYVRAHRQQEKSGHEDKPKRSSARHFASLLDSIDPEEIKDFIRDHARSDQWFKMKIQARFYDKKNLDEKESFLESLFPVVTQTKSRKPTKKISAFVKICGELLDCFKSYIQQNDFIEAYRLIFGMVKKSFYIKFHYGPSRDHFIENHENLLKNFHETIDLIEAPEFRQSVLKDLADFLSSSYITLHSANERGLWVQLIKTSDDKDLLLTVNQKFLSPPIGDRATYYFMLANELILLDEISRKDAIRSLSGQEMYRVVHHLIEMNWSSEANACLREIVMLYRLNYPILMQILNNINRDSVDDELEKRLLDYFEKFKESSLIRYLAEYTGLDYKRFTQTDTAKLLKTDWILHIQVLMAFDLHEKAFDLLEEHADISSLKRFDRELAIHLPDRMALLYLALSKTYLQQHFGSQARGFVRDLRNHLGQILDRSAYRIWEEGIQDLLSNRRPSKTHRI